MKKDRVASPESANSFIKSRLPFRREARNEKGRIASPESVPIYPTNLNLSRVVLRP